MTVRSIYYHYNDADNRKRARAKLKKQNKTKKRKETKFIAEEKNKKIQSCDEKMTNVSGQQG